MRKTINNFVYKHRKNLAKLTLVLLTIAFVVLLILPATYFDTGRAMCLSVILTNKQCYGCGLTRGIQHLIHFDFAGAWQFNKLSFIVLPLAIFLILKDLLKVIMQKESEQNEKQ